tara:strand:- start:2327 stop:2485 length:159 start_codon:yes stop_codon:yes gene_type:complete
MPSKEVPDIKPMAKSVFSFIAVKLTNVCSKYVTKSISLPLNITNTIKINNGF